MEPRLCSLIEERFREICGVERCVICALGIRQNLTLHAYLQKFVPEEEVERMRKQIIERHKEDIADKNAHLLLEQFLEILRSFCTFDDNPKHELQHA
jgi:hypothetical protein